MIVFVVSDAGELEGSVSIGAPEHGPARALPIRLEGRGGDAGSRSDILLRMSLISNVGQIAIVVSDLSRAVAFYRDILELPFLFQVPNLAFFDCGGVRLMLDTPETPASGGNSIVYFRTADIHGASETLAARGVTFEGKPHMIAKMPDHELWMAFFRDSEGNLLALMSEVR